MTALLEFRGTGASVISAPGVPSQAREVVPVLQAQDGSFVGTVEVGDTPTSYMIAFDATGSLRWSVPGYTPQIATADGGVIATSNDDGSAVTFDQNGKATGQIDGLPIQSWTGNQYQLGSVQSVVAPLVFEDGASFWSTVGGNPSGNGTAILQCPCLLQSALTAATAVSPSGNQKTYLVMAGDPGLNLGPGHMWNVGELFNLAAETKALDVTQSGNNTVITRRVSSFSDFSTALTANGLIDGDITYFGHAGIDRHGNLALFPGQNFGDAYNVSVINVGQLSNANLSPNVTITLNACHAGFGGKRSIAQLIANQLKRPVLAYPVDVYFSSDPTPRRFQKGMVAPNGVPTYMVPNGDGMQPIRFPLR